MRVNWKDRTGINRRSFFSLVSAGVPAAVALSSCGIPGITPKPYDKRRAPDESADHQLTWSNWPLNIDTVKNPVSGNLFHPSLHKFHQETGISVRYSEEISDNNIYFGKIRPLLATNAYPGTDLMVLTDWMASRMIRYGWVQPFQTSHVPHLANINPLLPRNLFDEELSLSAPYIYGLVSIAYNEKATGGKRIDSITQMLTDKELRGRVALLSEMEQTVSLVMLDNGIDPSQFTEQDFDKVLEILQSAIERQQIKAFTGNEYIQGLLTGDFAACVVYSGDIMQLSKRNPHIKFVFPDSGMKMYTDNFMIPSFARHKTNAEKLINFYYEPENSALLYSTIKYVEPVRGAEHAMKKIAPDLVHNPLIFPPEKELAKAKIFKNLSAEEEKSYFSRYQKLIGI